MEEHPQQPRRSRWMKILPPSPLEETPIHRKNKKTQIIETTSETNLLESSLPINTELEITSLLTSEPDIVEMEAPETLEPEVQT